jgi:hypothetical protein
MGENGSHLGRPTLYPLIDRQEFDVLHEMNAQKQNRVVAVPVLP